MNFWCLILGHKMPKGLVAALHGAILRKGVKYTCDRCGRGAYRGFNHGDS